MKKVALSVFAALAVSLAAPAFAADMPVKAPKVAVVATPSPWDIAFGAAIMSDYVWRGVTQSGHKPSVAAYFEPRYNFNSNLQAYVGLSGESIKFANNAAAEIDFYGGIRPTIGPVAFDFGFWYYYYPGGTCYVGNAACPSAIPNGNVAKALKRIDVERALVIGVSTDILFPLSQQEEIADGLRAAGAQVDFVALDSPQGHDAFLVDIPRFGAAIARFLATL